VRNVAVLPFRNEAKDEGIEYLSDGVTESLIQRISRLPSLNVMAYSTVLNFKDKPHDLRELERLLHVDAILTGSISLRSGRLRITAELVEVATGVRLWGDTYDRAASEVVSIEDDIARAIIDDGIRLRLSGEERRALARRLTDDREAYTWYLMARHAQLRGAEPDLLEARALLERAIQRDSRFAQAYKLLGANHASAALVGFEPPTDAFAQASRYVDRALEIDPQLAEAHATAAFIAFAFKWDWPTAEREWALANSLPKGAVPTQELVGESFGRWALHGPEAALRVIKRLREIDPLTLSYAVSEADYLRHAGRLDEAATLYEAINAGGVNANALFGLAEVRAEQRRFDAALEARRKAHEAAGDDAALLELFDAARGRGRISAGRSGGRRARTRGARGSRGHRVRLAARFCARPCAAGQP
jgi:TolB-like protein